MKMKTKRKKLRDSSSSSQSNVSLSSDLHTAVIRIAVAQICKSVGYTGAQISALKTLTDVAVRFLRSLATSAATSANSTGRTQCNLYDVIRALEDLHSRSGFIGNSDSKRRLCILSDSSILRDTMKFVYLTREIPFARPLPRRRYEFPANPPCFESENQIGRLYEHNHIPRWLPEFPKIADDGGKMVVPEASGDEAGCENRLLRTESDRKFSKLPEKRKKVSFRIRCGGRNLINMESGGDLCQIYDDEKFVNASCNHDVKVKQCTRKKMKLQEQILMR